MAKEPRLDPPDYDDGPEPTDQEWTEWRLRDMDYLVEDDDIVEACDSVLREIGQALIDNKNIDYAKIGKDLEDAVKKYAAEGDMSEVAEWQQHMADKASEDFNEPDEPDYEPCPRFYDGTGKY